MNDDAGPRDSRHQLPILLGIVGAVLGFIGAVFLAPYNRMDPITSGLTALFIFGPIGAVVGAFGGARLGLLIRPAKPPAAESITAGAPAGVSTGTTTGNAFKALGVVVGVTAVVLGGWLFYEYQATPWLRPGNVRMLFEVKLPAGAAMPPAGDVKADLKTPLNTMPADMEPNLFRRDGDQPVIVGYVWLHYRTNSREIEVKIPGGTDRTYKLNLKASPPHAPQFGAWERHPDGSEIRYRVKWPGES